MEMKKLQKNRLTIVLYLDKRAAHVTIGRNASDLCSTNDNKKMVVNSTTFLLSKCSKLKGRT